MTVEHSAWAEVPQVVDVDPVTTAVIRDTVAMERITDFYDSAFTAVIETIQRQGRTHTTAGFGHYFGVPAETVDLEVGFGTDLPVEPDGAVRPGTLPGGRCARVVHVGGYEGLGESWQRLHDWIVEQGHEAGVSMWEEYETEPTPGGDPTQLRTVLTWPLTG